MAHKTFAHGVTWDPQVKSYLASALGAARLAAISDALARPSLRPTLRVNTLRKTPAAVVEELRARLGAAAAGAHPHPVVPSAVVLPGRGPNQPCYEELCGERGSPSHLIAINRYAGEAVLKGADVFSPGLLAATPGLAAGDLVAVSVALEEKPTRLTRGTVLRPDAQARLAPRHRLHVGVGRAAGGRVELFRLQGGMAVEMVERVYDIPPCNGVLRGDAMLQALPCIVAAHAMDPQPGWTVLDMCASPGGKTTMLAQLMGDAGRVIALDRTKSKVEAVRSLASDLGISIVDARVADSTQLCPPPPGAAGAPRQRPRAGAGAGGGGRAADGGVERLTDEAEAEGGGSGSEDKAAAGDAADEGGGGAAAAGAAEAGAWAGANALSDFPPESFDAVLLDAPCSALGLRPRLLHGWRLGQLQSTAGLQRALLHSAMHLLKPGGVLVYCTCTINPGENEGNVRFALDRWRGALELERQPLVLGGPGLSGPGWLSPEEASLVQRFDPGAGPDDTIGFFIARFRKTAPTAAAPTAAAAEAAAASEAAATAAVGVAAGAPAAR
ncbi:MAG: S-adenosyl-L-methionine-dependent methyltransferase [Monoraphidium minutum]|nr:MAG: S-adenosyl-L-methionine-dependent methyltransferase [Monoraphidium minutum]